MKHYKMMIFLLALITAIGVTTFSQAASQKTGRDESLRKGETRATVDSSVYSYDQRVRKAYQIAKEIPWVLDSIYCYCMCKESPAFRHISLLSCYVDDHASV